MEEVTETIGCGLQKKLDFLFLTSFNEDLSIFQVGIMEIEVMGASFI